MNDAQQFFDLAMKVIAHQASDAERAELDALLASEPGLKLEFKRLRAQVRVTQEALPLVKASEATAGELPGYAQERLRTKVFQTLGKEQLSTESASEKELKAMWRWRWVLGLAGATAVVALLLVPMMTKPAGPQIQVAMLDAAGPSRGSDRNETALLRQTWGKSTVESFSSGEGLDAWEASWAARGQMPGVKVVFDRAAGEVRVSGRWKGKSFEKTFLIGQDLATTLKQADAFIKENTTR